MIYDFPRVGLDITRSNGIWEALRLLLFLSPRASRPLSPTSSLNMTHFGNIVSCRYEDENLGRKLDETWDRKEIECIEEKI